MRWFHTQKHELQAFHSLNVGIKARLADTKESASMGKFLEIAECIRAQREHAKNILRKNPKRAHHMSKISNRRRDELLLLAREASLDEKILRFATRYRNNTIY